MSSAGDLVKAVLKRRGVTEDVRTHRLITAWQETVGDRVATRAWPDRLDKGVLSVRVINSAWMHELSFLRDELVDKANHILGATMVTKIRFHLGEKRHVEDPQNIAQAGTLHRPRLRPPKPEPKQLSPDAIAKIEKETARVRNDGVRDSITALRKRLGL